MSDDRRQSRRFALRQIIDVTFPRETMFQAEGLNLSEGGMMCRTSHPVEPLARVYLMLSLSTASGSYMLKTEGCIVHVEQKGDQYLFGMAFEHLEGQDLEALRAYLGSLDPETS